MIVSVHQPQYIPWLGYFDKIDKSNAFVFLDNVQYKKREYQNRNRICTRNGWKWLTVPVITKGRYHQKTIEVEIDNSQKWRRKHLKDIKIHYSKAPHFKEHIVFLESIFTQQCKRLIDININIIKYLLQYLGILTPIYYESEMRVESHSTDRIIELCQKLNADTYLSGNGGRNYLDETKFIKAGIKLVYQDFKHPVYQQLHNPFIPFMSIIDLVFNHGKESLSILRNGSLRNKVK